MRNIRKLSFRNAAGETWSLNGERGVYASNLSGLGVMLSATYADLSRGFFVPVSDESEPQATIPFTLTFTRNAYDTYQRFIDWISIAGTLTIVYNPTGKQDFCRDVFVNFLQKGELNPVGWLEVPCSFLCCTPWYLPTPTEFSVATTGADESKRYDYVYSEDLQYGTDSSASLSGSIAGAGHIPGALELTYHGAIANPKIRLVGDISGTIYGLCSINAILGVSDSLLFSTKYENAYAKRISVTGEETDLLDVLDLSTNPFFHIPVDEPCTISIESDAAFTGRAALLIYYYYRSV